MTPEYLMQLANEADPDQLWRLPAWDQLALPTEKRKQLDAGVALRRHAAHIDRLRGLLLLRRSLVITPLSPNSTATMTIVPPPRHKHMLEKRGQPVEAVPDVVRDAERYRWLFSSHTEAELAECDQKSLQPPHTKQDETLALLGGWYATKEQADKAIDAAIAAQKASAQ